MSDLGFVVIEFNQASGQPEVAPQAPYLMLTDELHNDCCPCGHTWDEHNFEVGCIAGWEYDGPDPGVATEEGCGCQLAHTEKSDLRWEA